MEKYVVKSVGTLKTSPSPHPTLLPVARIFITLEDAGWGSDPLTP